MSPHCKSRSTLAPRRQDSPPCHAAQPCRASGSMIVGPSRHRPAAASPAFAHWITPSTTSASIQPIFSLGSCRRGAAPSQLEAVSLPEGDRGAPPGRKPQTNRRRPSHLARGGERTTTGSPFTARRITRPPRRPAGRPRATDAGRAAAAGGSRRRPPAPDPCRPDPIPGPPRRSPARSRAIPGSRSRRSHRVPEVVREEARGNEHQGSGGHEREEPAVDRQHGGGDGQRRGPL